MKKRKIKCDNCGKIIWRFPSELKEYENHFCNGKCHGQWKSKNRIEKKVKCLNCGKEFLRAPSKIKRYKHHFCSSKCQRSWRRKRYQIKCSFCATSLEIAFHSLKRSKKHFCNLKCWKAYQKSSKRKVNCSNCGKLLWRIAWRLKNQKNHFCNETCLAQWKKKNSLKGERSPYFRQKKVRCSNCGKELWKHRYLIKKEKRFFCNYRCFSLWASRNLSKENSVLFKQQRVRCLNCRRVFWKHLSRVKNTTKHFCSMKCRDEYSVGENSSGWRDGRSFQPYTPDFNKPLKKLILRRDNYRCQLCGVPQEECIRKLHIHHIDYNKENNRKENLITLCLSCHLKTGGRRSCWMEYFKELFKSRKRISINGQKSFNFI